MNQVNNETTDTSNSRRQEWLWRERSGALPNSSALAYAVLGFAAGFVLMARDGRMVPAAGILLTIHAMVIAAYLIHETAHYNSFARPGLNRCTGEVMNWIAGSAYASFDRIRRLHLRHHRYRLRRILNEGYGAVGSGPERTHAYLGAQAVSFLTVV